MLYLANQCMNWVKCMCYLDREAYCRYILHSGDYAGRAEMPLAYSAEALVPN